VTHCCVPFFFTADCLSKLLQQEVDRGALEELHVSRRGLDIFHLLFADDTLLFMKASEERAIIVTKTMQCYECCTRQLINPSKCSILFGAATDQEARDTVMSTLQVSNIATEDKYLGLPMPHGRMTKEKYKSTKETDQEVFKLDKAPRVCRRKRSSYRRFSRYDPCSTEGMTSWPGTMRDPEFFTVKSVYRLMVEEKRRREGLDARSSGATDGRSMYKDLWNADVPPKV
jgi:hypothetical protein